MFVWLLYQRTFICHLYLICCIGQKNLTFQCGHFIHNNWVSRQTMYHNNIKLHQLTSIHVPHSEITPLNCLVDQGQTESAIFIWSPVVFWKSISYNVEMPASTPSYKNTTLWLQRCMIKNEQMHCKSPSYEKNKWSLHFQYMNTLVRGIIKYGNPIFPSSTVWTLPASLHCLLKCKIDIFTVATYALFFCLNSSNLAR